MKKTYIPVLFLILASFVLFACGSGNDQNTDGDTENEAGDGDIEIEDADNGETDGDGDSIESDSDVELEADGDNESEIEADETENEEVFEPIEPAPIADEMVIKDTAFVQEFNHTIPEVPEGVGELVAVIKAPQTYAAFDKATMIAPRGFFVPAQKTGDKLFVEIDISATDIIDAESTSEAIYFVTSEKLYKINSDKSISEIGDIPGGDSVSRLYSSQNNIYVLTTTALGVYTGSDEISWNAFATAPTAMDINDSRMILAWEYQIAGYSSDSNPDGLNPDWTYNTSDLALGTPVAVIQDLTLPQELDFVVVGTDKLAGFSIEGNTVTKVDVAMFADDRVPFGGATAARADENGGFIVATTNGAYRLIEDIYGVEYKVYVPQRWMPSEDVMDVLLDTSVTNGDIHFATAKGPGVVTRSSLTMEEKMSRIVDVITSRHDRDGAVADSRLTIPGDLSTSIPWDSDNDGGWTCYWVLSECFRYKLTNAADAKANFDKSLARMLSFRTLTGTDYFLARSVIRIDGCQLDDCDDPDDGEWFKSPDEEWWVKADTSNDEVTSHMFMMGHAYDYCADEEQKQAIVEHVDGIIGGIVDNGYALIDPQDGECTSYGQFDPWYMKIIGAVADGGRRSAQIIGALNFAYYLTGKQKYMDAKQELIEEHGYDDYIANLGDGEVYPFCGGNPDCDELALQAYFPLLRYEHDAELRAKWLTGWNRLYSHLVTQEDAYWEFANAYLGGDNIDLSNSFRWLRRYPTDMVRWTIKNEARQDIVPPPEYYLLREKRDDFKLRSDGHIFPTDERPSARHNATQFGYLGGSGGYRELDGGSALFTYWLGRFYGFISEPE